MFGACKLGDDVVVSNGPIKNFFATCVGQVTCVDGSSHPACERKPLHALSPQLEQSEQMGDANLDNNNDDGLVLAEHQLRCYLLKHNCGE
jgi:hypothetical protein